MSFNHVHISCLRFIIDDLEHLWELFMPNTPLEVSYLQPNYTFPLLIHSPHFQAHAGVLPQLVYFSNTQRATLQHIVSRMPKAEFQKFITKGKLKPFDDKSAFVDAVLDDSKWTSFVQLYGQAGVDPSWYENMKLYFRPCQPEPLVPYHVAPRGTFLVDYLKMGKTVEDFLSLIDEFVTSKPSEPLVPESSGTSVAENPKYFSPYTCILNSSGMGKTRFILDCEKHDDRYHCVMIVVNCSVTPNVESFPSASFFRSFCAFLREKEELVKIAANLVGFLMLEVAKIVREAIRPDSTADPIVRDKIVCGKGIFIDELFGSTSEAVKKLSDCIVRAETNDLVATSEFKTAQLIEYKGRKVVLSLAFDEAGFMLHELVKSKSGLFEHPSMDPIADFLKVSDNSEANPVSYFRLFRRSLRELAPRLLVPTFLCSTNTSLGNFMVPYFEDPSRRNNNNIESTQQISLLHRPLIIQESFDTFAVNKVNIKQKRDWYQRVRTSEYYAHLFYYGRPLWGSILECSIYPTISEEVLFDKVLEGLGDIERKLSLAFPDVDYRKAMPAISEDFRKMRYNEMYCLQILGFTIHLPPLDTSTYGAALVKSRLAFLHYFSPLDGRFLVGFQSEPVAAMVSMSELIKRPGYIVGHLNRLATEKGIDIGGRGEMAARIILLFGIQSTEPIPFKFPVPEPLLKLIKPAFPRKLDDVLRFMVGEEAYERELALWGDGRDETDGPAAKRARSEGSSASSVLMFGCCREALISCSHFTRISTTEQISTLLLLGMARNAGIIPRDKYPGIDLLVPLAIPDGSLGCLAVQVKNAEEVRYREDFSKMEKILLEKGIPSAVMLILGVATRSPRVKFLFGYEYPAVMILGLGYPFFTASEEFLAQVTTLGDLDRHKRRQLYSYNAFNDMIWTDMFEESSMEVE